MKIICVLGNETSAIVKNLKETYASLDIDSSFSSSREMVSELTGTPVRVDKLLINEDAFSSGRLTDELIELQALINSKFFSPKEVIFLLDINKDTDKYISHLFQGLEEPKISIHKKESYNFQSITYLLGGKDLLEQNKVDVEYSTVVRQRIGQDTTITLMAGEENNNKGAIVYDDIDAVVKLFEKLEAQKNLIAIQNTEISTDVIQPKMTGLPKLEVTPEQFLHADSYNKTRNTQVYVVSGERGSGKTTAAYALAKSYQHANKVLLIDLCEHNMGLSALIEELKENISVLFLHTILGGKDATTTKAIIEKFSNQKTPLSAISLSAETKDILNSKVSLEDSESVLSSITEILLASLKPKYDIIIIDLPLAKYSQYSFVFNTCDYVLLTFYKSISSVVSLGAFMLEKRLYHQWYKTIFIPTDVYREIDGRVNTSPMELKSYLEIFLKHKVAMTNPIRLTGFDLGPELSMVVDKLISALPSKTDISNYNEYINSEKENVNKPIEMSTDFVNPFVPTTKEIEPTEEDDVLNEINLEELIDGDTLDDIEEFDFDLPDLDAEPDDEIDVSNLADMTLPSIDDLTEEVDYEITLDDQDGNTTV